MSTRKLNLKPFNEYKISGPISIPLFNSRFINSQVAPSAQKQYASAAGENIVCYCYDLGYKNTHLEGCYLYK